MYLGAGAWPAATCPARTTSYFQTSSRLTGVNLNYIMSTRVLSLLSGLASLVTIACLRDERNKNKPNMGWLDRRGVV